MFTLLYFTLQPLHDNKERFMKCQLGYVNLDQVQAMSTIKRKGMLRAIAVPNTNVIHRQVPVILVNTVPHQNVPNPNLYLTLFLC